MQKRFGWLFLVSIPVVLGIILAPRAPTKNSHARLSASGWHKKVTDSPLSGPIAGTPRIAVRGRDIEIRREWIRSDRILTLELFDGRTLELQLRRTKTILNTEVWHGSDPQDERVSVVLFLTPRKLTGQIRIGRNQHYEIVTAMKDRHVLKRIHPAGGGKGTLPW